MKKRKRILIAASALALCVLAILLLSGRPSEPTQVIGNLSPQDVAEIKREVRYRLWHEVFSTFSWDSIRRLPRRVYYASAGKIAYIKRPERQSTVTGFYNLQTNA